MTKIYAENLPAQCPPNSAIDQAWENVFRIVTGPAVGPDEFKSHAANDKPNRLNVNQCVWASCSLFKDIEAHMERWPRIRERGCFIARLSVPSGAGMSKSKKDSNHIDFWRFSATDLSQMVVEVVQVQGKKYA